MKNDFIRNKNIKNQPKKAVKKTFSFYALVFALLFMFIGSILGSIAFVRTSVTESSTNIAYADSVGIDYRYIGSNIYVPSSYYIVNKNGDDYYIDYETNYRNFDVISIQFDLFNGIANFEGAGALSVPIFKPALDLSVGNSFTNGLVLYYINTDNKLIQMTSDRFYYRDVINDNYYGTYALCTFLDNGSRPFNAFYFSVNMDKGFSCNVQRFRLNSILDSIGEDTLGTYVVQRNVLTYYDESNRECRFTFDANTYVGHNANNPNGTGFLDRTYFLTGSSGDGGYSQSYIDELISQYDKQIQDIADSYEARLENARESAYQQGYNAGLSTENTTFLSLFGALFDAPIQAISGLLNFDVLGFNLWNFFTAVITIGIVIFVVRLFL